MFDDEALEEKSCFTNNGKIKYTLMTLIINWLYNIIIKRRHEYG